MRCLWLALFAVLSLAGAAPARDLDSVVKEIAEDPAAGGMDPAWLAGRVRQAYEGDEAQLIRDALAYSTGEEDGAERMLQMLWSQLDLGRQARPVLIAELVAAEAPSVRERAWYLLQLGDQKPKPDEPESFVMDLSGHAGWITDVESMPQEYLLYLFKQDGTRTWELLGGSDAELPVLGRLAGIAGTATSNLEKGKVWRDEIKPGLRNGEAITTSRDAAYLAWFLGMLYGSDEKVRRNNPEVAAVIDRMIPGLGGALMKGRMGGVDAVRPTPAAVSAEWIADRRARTQGARGASHDASSAEGRSSEGKRRAPGMGESGSVVEGAREHSLVPWIAGGVLLLLGWVWLRKVRGAR